MKKFIFSDPVVVPVQWYVTCETEHGSEDVCSGSKEECVQYMEDILNEAGMERFQTPGYNGSVFQRHPETVWSLCWLIVD